MMTDRGPAAGAPAPAPPPLHPPKREVFDVPAMTNTDNKGFVREVDEYRVTEYGLYMSRRAPGHPRFDHLESWLLPALGLRANIFHYQGGYREGQRLYLDIGHFHGPDEHGHWHAEDWYLDLVDVPGTPPVLLDADELLEAHRSGLLETVRCVEAMEIAMRALVGSAEHGHDVQAWLDATAGGVVFFRDHRYDSRHDAQ
ncbi:DUF402 domain-containing protein [Gordonia sp. 'Campus']|uniref:DUF402 domain-containing protein n=1 Tax=Gordonia sp. 'Campus' TaxID=2915824 RepID=UPI001EE3D2E8|nr:DUF402 domain-containing protein [Gordonia sp. 'Campus']